MMETSVRKIIFYSSYPLINKNLTTGIAEGSFAGARNNYMLQSVKVSSTSVKAWESSAPGMNNNLAVKVCYGVGISNH